MLVDTRDLAIKARAKIDAGKFTANWLNDQLTGKDGGAKYEAESAMLLILDLMAYMLALKSRDVGADANAWGEGKKKAARDAGA